MMLVEAKVLRCSPSSDGRLRVALRVANLEDFWEAARGMRTFESIRAVDIPDAVVDSRPTMLSLPSRYLAALGFRKTGEHDTPSSRGTTSANLDLLVRLTIEGHDCTVQVTAVADTDPP